MKLLNLGNYDAVIHCAAWTAVDKAEDEVEACTKVNVDGTKNIANVCKELNIPMMYFLQIMYLMDKVINLGMNMTKRYPLNVYGQTKYEGELAVEALDKHFHCSVLLGCSVLMVIILSKQCFV
ncbi:MAG: sugar nucleotide-binding protein [Thomasclavelia sp.]